MISQVTKIQRYLRKIAMADRRVSPSSFVFYFISCETPSETMLKLATEHKLLNVAGMWPQCVAACMLPV